MDQVHIDKLLCEYEDLKTVSSIDESKLTYDYIDSLYNSKIYIEDDIHKIKGGSVSNYKMSELTTIQLNTLIYELYNRINDSKQKLAKYDNKQIKPIRKIYQNISHPRSGNGSRRTRKADLQQSIDRLQVPHMKKSFLWANTLINSIPSQLPMESK